MAFPDSVLPIKQELLINGVWTDITAPTRGEQVGGVQIRRGYSGEQASLSAAQANFTLENTDGRFSNRNPLSPYYGLIGRNTQYRVSVTETATSLRLADYSDAATGFYDGANVSTADKAVLDITGDIDIRADVEPDDWYGQDGYHLASKYVLTGNQRSWAFFVTSTGRLRLTWSTDGTSANRFTSTSTAAVPDGGRLCVRVTLDVDNGAAGNTTTFYTAPSLAGPWTALGSTTVKSGITNIFASTAPLEVGTINDGGVRNILTNPSIAPFVGRVYAFELYSGIAGTRVANMSATSQSTGTTSWSDGLGTPNTWTLRASAEITNADYRFWGETGKLPQRWDSSGRDVTVPVVASDIVQRLMQGAKPLRSPIYRNLTQNTLVGYWPLEDGGATTSHPSAVVGLPGFIREASFGADVDLPGSAGKLGFSNDNGYASGNADPRITGSTGINYMLFYFKFESLPVSPVTIMNFYQAQGTVYRVDLVVSSTSYTINFRTSTGFVYDTFTSGFGAGGEPNQWIAMRVMLTQTNPALTTWEWAWYPVGGSVIFGQSGSYAGRAGRPRSWISYEFAGKANFNLAHVALAREDLGFTSYDFTNSTNGYTGEPADLRFARLCREERFRAWIIGRRTNSSNTSTAEKMGAQRPSTLINLLQECTDLVDGIMYGPRDKFGLTLRMWANIINRTTVDLDYTANHLSGSIEPDEDDSLIRNDVTVTRPSGGQGHAVQTSGPLNVNDPATDPDGVGVYDVSLPRVAFEDTRLPALAEYEKFLGTWDELRYKKVTVQLQRRPFVNSPTLTAQVRRLDLGRALKITNLPAWLPPEDVELLIRGYTETLKNFAQEITWNTSPYGPYRVNDLTGSANSRRRVGAESTLLAAAATSSATSLTLYTPRGKLWRRSSGAPTGTYPMNVTIAGEQVSATALSNATISFVAAGAVAHANNASVVPGLPAGWAAGDVLFMLAAIRNTAAAPGTVTGWEKVSFSENVALYARLATGGMTAPTVPFAGGVVGDDTSAQIVAFRPSTPLLSTLTLADLLSSAEWQSNASAQNITYPPGTLFRDITDNALVLYLGWKQDDWTSVTSPGIEIGEPSTTTGNDQGIVWAYAIQTTRTAIPQGVFTVTGGASAVSKGAIMFINLRHQIATVSRGQNGISKAQAAGESRIQVTEPFYTTR
jgi:hypothetical protein